jgi:uncharacterized cupin superfamily protein
MTPNVRPILNLDQVILEHDGNQRLPGTLGERFDLRRGPIAERIGARQLGYRLIVVAPGKRSCPFHSHRVEEEMFFILEGHGELRYGAQTHALRAGDIIACPTGGPETAHQIINTGDADLRYLAVSTVAEVEICEYPDSGKFLASAAPRHAGEEELDLMAHHADAVDYWEGE